MRFSSRLIAAGAVAAALASPAAFAGEQYVDETGFAVSGYDVVAYFDMAQAPIGSPQPEAVPGRADITADYNGATWAFSSEENRDRFLADPEAYAPAYDGHCAYGIALDGKVPANPHLWRIVDGQLYLNITRNVVGFWEADVPGFIDKAEDNWSALEPAPASSNPVPEFEGAAPIQPSS
jgi:YHS domain-containing protein